ncbi:hypothetical protein BOX15_Mlig017608g1 [Macrostomum lignano]|uniref:Uncharacterized protein n=2 Tax=Macrostomum lignano TaxID=282301 RepID=A0A267E9H1_9PLAT|nr:hypothetical protein BOX15_Mlig017608g1 [Macrostomum lignano]
MKFSLALLIVLVAAVCLVGSSDAWGRKRWRSGNRGGRGNWSSGSNGTFYLLVRKVDEPHPYFRTLQLNTLNNSFANLSNNLATFFNQSTDNITMIVRNDKQLIATDFDASKVKYKDQLEVHFKGCGSPTRGKTLYAYAKEARRNLWPERKQKDKKKNDAKRGRERSELGRPGRDERRRRPAASEVDEADEALENYFF